MSTLVLFPQKIRFTSVVDAAGTRISPIVRFLLGALLGLVPFVITVLLPADYRSPYLLAYPIVILSAWLWGLPGAIACASVDGLVIEHFIFSNWQVPLGPLPHTWLPREIVFLGGSILVGFLTRRAALQREKVATAALEQELARMAAERSAAEERERAAELLVENEVRAQMALDGASAGVWEWDIIANSSKWSKGFYRLHDLEPGGPANYDIWREQVYPEDIDRVEASIMKAVEQVGRFSAEYRIQRPDGEVRWVICEGTSVPGSDGKAVLMRGYCGDITRRKLADLALIQSEKLALAGRLTASIAHEIRNPLDAAVNLLYLVKEAPLTEEQAAYIGKCIEQIDRVSQISQQTLSFSRRAGRASQCRPAELVQRTLDLLRTKLNLGKIQVEMQVREDSEFRCSTSEIQQILTNIINNAAEAMSPGGRLRIRISDSRDWKTRSTPGVRITVADNGTGMSRQTLQNLFEPFFTTKEGTGTGLGMWVVAELVGKHRGELTVSSSQNENHRGTVISLFFPK